MENLTKRFADAGLKLVIMSKPMVASRGAEDIVQIDIKRAIKGNARSEYFQIYPGRGDTSIQIRDVDKANNQLVLMVKEGKKVFEEEISLRRVTGEIFERRIKEEARRSGATIVRMDSNKSKATLRRTTPPEIRYYLMGVDERQLFIARLTEACETVEKARKSLGKTVQFADGKKANSADRQGEWFFIETTDAQRLNIADKIKEGKALLYQKAAIGNYHRVRRNGGKPHTADELVVLDRSAIAESDILPHGFPVADSQVFVKGAVRHADHKTVVFKHWRLVVANNEGNETARVGRIASNGMSWID